MQSSPNAYFVSVCDREASIMRRPRPQGVLLYGRKNIINYFVIGLFVTKVKIYVRDRVQKFPA